jgi:hypothetical protein
MIPHPDVAMSLVVVPTADHRKAHRWSKSCWDDDAKLCVMTQAVADNYWSFYGPERKNQMATFLAVLNSLRVISTKGTLTEGACESFLTAELAAREVARKKDEHATGAGDQECTAYTRALDDGISLRDDAIALRRAGKTKSAEDRARDARLKERFEKVQYHLEGKVSVR